MGIHRTSVSIEINAPAATVWARVQEHEKTETWVPAVKRVTLLREGAPRNGVPAIRRVEFRPMLWSTINEEIVRYEEGKSFDYKIVAGFPGLNDHLGSVTVEAIDPKRTRLTWTVMFDFRMLPMGPFASGFVRTFTRVLQTGIETLKQQLEKDSLA